MNKTETKFSDIPNQVQKYMMSFCDNRELLTLRYVDKKICNNATDVLIKKFENNEITVSNNYACQEIDKKIRQLIPEKEKDYFLASLGKTSFISAYIGRSNESFDQDCEAIIKNDDNTKFVLCTGKDLEKRTFDEIRDILWIESTNAMDNSLQEEYINNPKSVVPGDYEVKHFTISKNELYPIKKFNLTLKNSSKINNVMTSVNNISSYVWNYFFKK